jgi:hypothetical protein
MQGGGNPRGRGSPYQGLPPQYRGSLPPGAGRFPIPPQGRDPRGGFDPANGGDGKFVPVGMDEDIRVWVHDDGVTPGRTYQYKVRYRLLNPVWQKKAITTEELAKKFDIVSEFTDWSEPVEVPNTTQFWLASVSGGNAKVDVFTWKGGRWNRKEITAVAGDTIGATGWTVEDVRSHKEVRSGKPYVLLARDDGARQQRDYDADKNDAKHQEMLDVVSGKTSESADTGGRSPVSFRPSRGSDDPAMAARFMGNDRSPPR